MSFTGTLFPDGSLGPCAFIASYDTSSGGGDCGGGGGSDGGGDGGGASRSQNPHHNPILGCGLLYKYLLSKDVKKYF